MKKIFKMTLKKLKHLTQEGQIAISRKENLIDDQVTGNCFPHVFFPIYRKKKS